MILINQNNNMTNCDRVDQEDDKIHFYERESDIWRDIPPLLTLTFEDDDIATRASIWFEMRVVSSEIVILP